MTSTSQPKTVGVVGGGLAGLAAGCALADAGLKVTLFERRPYVGGRASSYEHPGTGEVVDNCQHVLFGCCTNLIHFYETLGVADNIGWSSEINFVQRVPLSRAARSSTALSEEGSSVSTASTCGWVRTRSTAPGAVTQVIRQPG